MFNPPMKSQTYSVQLVVASVSISFPRIFCSILQHRQIRPSELISNSGKDLASTVCNRAQRSMVSWLFASEMVRGFRVRSWLEEIKAW